MPKLGADDGACVGAEVGAVTVERTLPFQSEECLIMHHETPDARLEVEDSNCAIRPGATGRRHYAEAARGK